MSQKQVETQSTEYIEFAVKDLDESSKLYEHMGFECVGLRTLPTRKSKLYSQGDIHFVLSASSSDSDDVFKFTRKHGDGVINVGYKVDDPEESYQIACSRGAASASSTQISNGLNQTTQTAASIHVYGDVLNTFVNYSNGGKFENLFTEDHHPINSHKGKYLQTIDHITVNVEKGEMDRWADFYKDIFGFKQIRYFDIRTGRTGLLSRALRNQNGRVTMPFNEPTEKQSQIQEFIDTLKGPGVQHIALHTSNIVSCLSSLIPKGFKFLQVPETYYAEVPKRVPNVSEDLKELQKLGILVDGTSEGYLLQIFTEPVVGPFFFEFIQRRGDDGFGEGNFRALFEAIERDQMKRGVL